MTEKEDKSATDGEEMFEVGFSRKLQKCFPLPGFASYDVRSAVRPLIDPNI